MEKAETNKVENCLTWALLLTMMAPKTMIAITLQTSSQQIKENVSVDFSLRDYTEVAQSGNNTRRLDSPLVALPSDHGSDHGMLARRSPARHR